MIIGINGYIGSGKDTVGQMIIDQNRYWDDTLSIPRWFWNDQPWEIKKFAGKLKQIATLLTGIPIKKFEDQAFKKTYLGKEWSYSKPLLRGDMLQQYKHWEDVDMTVREFLQLLGTEAIREGLHTNAWVNALFADYKEKQDDLGPSGHTTYPTYSYPNWIITDTRFPNEAKVIKDRGGIIVRVERGFDDLKIGPHELRIQRDPSTLHSSETALDDWKFDYVIDNSGSLEDLEEKVKELLNNIKN